jgi:hypothetical protein
MAKGWIKLHREFISWSNSRKNKEDILAFLYFLLRASHEKQEIGVFTVSRGSFATSYNAIAEYLDTSKQTARSTVNRLKRTGEIKVQSLSNNGILITIVNYAKYQETPKPEAPKLIKVEKVEKPKKAQKKTDNDPLGLGKDYQQYTRKEQIAYADKKLLELLGPKDAARL